MDTLIAMINDLMWGAVLIYLLIGVGIFFTFRLGFIQIRHFGHMFSVLRNSRKSDSAGISSFQALVPACGPRGTGNLAGVAVAIYLGGPGAIFDVADRFHRHGHRLRREHPGPALQGQG
jgi:AGCS family alanine or glycine:cation symporter